MRSNPTLGTNGKNALILRTEWRLVRPPFAILSPSYHGQRPLLAFSFDYHGILPDRSSHPTALRKSEEPFLSTRDQAVSVELADIVVLTGRCGAKGRVVRFTGSVHGVAIEPQD
jgi:hypothetical protein